MSRRPEGSADGFVPFLLEEHERMAIFVWLVERWARDVVRKALTVRL